MITNFIKLNNKYTIIDNIETIDEASITPHIGELYFYPEVNGVRECKIGDGERTLDLLPKAGCGVLAGDGVAGLVTSGGDVEIEDGVISVKDDSHKHTTTLASNSGTATINLVSGNTYQLTAGGNSVIFKMPAHPTNKNVVGNASTDTSNETVSSNGIYLNHLEGSTVKSSHKITGAGATTVTATSGNITITSADTKVTAAGNHYTPTTDAASALSADASATTTASWGTTSIVTGITLNRDTKGHVTGVTVDSVKMPTDPSTQQGTTVNTATTAEKVAFQSLAANTGYSLLLNPGNSTTAAAPGYSTTLKYNPSSKTLYPSTANVTTLGTTTYPWKSVNSTKGVFSNSAASGSTEVSLLCGTTASVSASQLRVGSAGYFTKNEYSFARTDNGTINDYGNSLFGADANGFGIFRFPTSETSNMLGSYGATGWKWSITRSGRGEFSALLVGGINVSLEGHTHPHSHTIAANTTDGMFNLTGTSGTDAVTYAIAPYSTRQSTPGGKFDTATTNPTGTNRLNYNGYLYATKLYSGGVEVSTTDKKVEGVSTASGSSAYPIFFKNSTGTTTTAAGARFNTGFVYTPGSSAVHTTLKIASNGAAVTLDLARSGNPTYIINSGDGTTGGNIGICAGQVTANLANSVVFTGSAVYPGTNSGKTGQQTLGTTDNKWRSVYATQFYGSGLNLTNLNASNLASGTIPKARLPREIARIQTLSTTNTGTLINNTTVSVTSGNIYFFKIATRWGDNITTEHIVPYLFTGSTGSRTVCAVTAKPDTASSVRSTVIDLVLTENTLKVDNIMNGGTDGTSVYLL